MDLIHRMTVERLRLIANHVFHGLSWVLVLICTAVAWLGGRDVPVTFALSSCAAIAVSVVIGAFGTRPVARALVAMGLAAQCLIVVLAASKLSAAFVQEAHMFYMVTDCLLLAYACGWTLAVFNICVTTYLVALTFGAPVELWGVASAPHAVLHLTIHMLIGSTLVGPLIFGARQLRSTLRSNATALRRAAQATDKAQVNIDEAERARHAAEQRAAFVGATAGSLDGELQTLLQNILDAALDVGRSATSVADVSRASSDNTGTVESIFDRTVSSLGDVAWSADALARSVVEIAERAEATAEKTQCAVAESIRAASLVEALNLSGERIGHITRIIGTVAESINLLALNATIEAARAGEAGQGFMTVAHNVKILAAQTSKATDEIKVMIASIRDETRAAASAIKTITDAMSFANDDASGIAMSAAQQTATTKSIATTISAIAGNAGHVRQQMGSTLQLLTSARTMADDLTGASRALRRMTERSTDDCVALLDRLRQA